MARNIQKPAARKQGTSGRARPQRRMIVLVATRKGAWLYHGDAARKTWRADGPHFLGHIISHLVLDPRDGRTLLAAAKTGHLGPTVFRSTDCGRSWKEAARPPAFAKAADGEGRTVDHTFWLTPAHANEPNVWYAGTSPQGLFRSEDGGVSWELFSSVNEDPRYREWMGSAQDGTPDGPKMHSIIVDPRNPSHLYFAMSGGGVHETLDKGRTWAPIVKGLEVVEGFDPAAITFHDPHCVRLCPSNPDRLYQQNHCGIYRSEDGGRRWESIEAGLPSSFGFPATPHPRDPDTLYLLPLNGDSAGRYPPDGCTAVWRTSDGGRTWQDLREGLPQRDAYFAVLRQAMAADTLDPAGIYFGTNTGTLFASADEGDSWSCVAQHLPTVLSVETLVVDA